MFSLSHFINKKPKKTFSTINAQASILELEDCISSAKSHELVYNSSKEFDIFENMSLMNSFEISQSIGSHSCKYILLIKSNLYFFG